MKLQFVLLALLVSSVFSCSQKEENTSLPVVEFSSEKQKLSYSLGADYAKRVLNSEIDELVEVSTVIENFEKSLNDSDYSYCEETLLDAFGVNFMDVDSTKKKQGSECFGKVEASGVYKWLKQVNQIDNIDLNYISYGYRDALLKRDTLINQGERASLLSKFQSGIQTEMMNKMNELEQPFFENAKALNNARTIDGGIVIETLKEGKNGSPKTSDEVTVNYILTNTLGDTLESSFKRGQPLTISLQSVIPGWTMSFPHLKKGGEYNLYIPSSLGYGMSKGALKFYVELISFGPSPAVAQ